jgi:hypothetical protein
MQDYRLDSHNKGWLEEAGQKSNGSDFDTGKNGV